MLAFPAVCSPWLVDSAAAKLVGMNVQLYGSSKSRVTQSVLMGFVGK